ncbi:MAG: GTP-binding protein [Betaproteobacteria bacterium]|nr:GTP-binding protein [Betaproteobacteria bacterium]
MTATTVTPVTLLTGYLGSGKTTVLNYLLKQPALADTAVLINEFGAISIDHLLVREASEHTMVLSNGCLCCAVAGDMVQALRDLYFKRSNGEVAYFKRVMIETTGLADPAPIMRTLMDLPLVAARYAFSGIVTTVDAEHGEGQLDQHFESIRQVAMADRIVITKSDRVSATGVQALAARLTRLNPGARQCLAVAGEVDPTWLLDTGLYQPDNRTADVGRWLSPGAYLPTSPDGLSVRPLARHDPRIRAFALSFDQVAPWQDWVAALEALVSRYGEHLLRVKGVIHAQDASSPRAIHVVQHTLYPYARLSAGLEDDRRSQLVFITRDLSEPAIRAVLEF